MTEQEWLSSAEPAAMLAWILPTRSGDASPLQHETGRAVTSDRKLRLFACAWWRSIKPHSDDAEHLARAVEEHGRVNGEEGAGATIDVQWLLDDCLMAARDKSDIGTSGAALLRDVFGNPWEPAALPVCPGCDGDGKAHGADRPFEWTPEKGYPGPCPTCDGFRFVLPPWLTRTAVALAEAAYQERAAGRCHYCAGMTYKTPCPHCHGTGRAEAGHLDPDRLLVLGDCLEEAGCQSEELLRHLRSSGPHVRGCWAIDILRVRELTHAPPGALGLLLGKEVKHDGGYKENNPC